MSEQSQIVFGVDVGGSGVKGAPVAVGTGTLVTERERFETPQPATPEAIASTIVALLMEFSWHGPIGVTIPGVVQHDVVRTAANIDPSWVGCDFAALLERRHGVRATILNDADAAGVAEMTYGVGAGRNGLVAMVTFGTGIGTALFVDGTLVPNSELGHIELNGGDAERYAAAKIRKRDGLSWADWAGRVDEYLTALENLIWPDLFVLGGGVSKKSERWVDQLTIRTPIEVAELRNDAGIVGAAMQASRVLGGG